MSRTYHDTPDSRDAERTERSFAVRRNHNGTYNVIRTRDGAAVMRDESYTVACNVASHANRLNPIPPK